LAVDPATVGGTVNSDHTLCYSDTPADLTLSDFTGLVLYWQSSADEFFTNPVTINVTTPVLPGETTGNLYASTYFRAVVRSGVCQTEFSSHVLVTVNPLPTLSGAAQQAPVCEGSPATINLYGLLPGSTSSLTYSIGGIDQTPVTGVVANGAGEASFNTIMLSASNNGQTLLITSLLVTSAEPQCSELFEIGVTLVVYPESNGGTALYDQIICQGDTPADLNLAEFTGSVLKWQYASDAVFTTPTDIEVASSTLPGTAIGPLYNNTYFRAVVQSGVCGMVYSAPAMITVNLTPVLVTHPQTVCTPARVNLTLPAVTAGSTLPPNTIFPFTYWQNPEATIPVPNPTSVFTGTYYIKAMTTDGCFDIQPVTVLVNPLPIVYEGTGSGCYCPTTQPGLQVGLAGSQIGVNYSLYIGLTFVYGPVPGTGGPISFGLQSVPGVYWVLAENTTTGCINRMYNCIYICITEPLVVSVSITASENPVVAGSDVTFTAIPGNGGALPSYQWKVNGFDAGPDNPVFTYKPFDGDEITCVLTSSEPCVSGPALSNVIVMTVTGVAPEITVTGQVGDGQSKCYNATQTLTIAGGGTSFIVYAGGSAEMIAGVNILYLHGTTIHAGAYMHGYISDQYCGTKSPAIVTANTGTEEQPVIATRTTFKLYPNPTSGNFTVEQTGGGLADEVKVEIYSMRGERLLSSGMMSMQQKLELSIADYPAGLYFVKVASGNLVETFKVIKTR
jgi:hypothetical protein